jgi:hypothetical protein
VVPGCPQSQHRARFRGRAPDRWPEPALTAAPPCGRARGRHRLRSRPRRTPRPLRPWPGRSRDGLEDPAGANRPAGHDDCSVVLEWEAVAARPAVLPDPASVRSSRYKPGRRAPKGSAEEVYGSEVRVRTPTGPQMSELSRSATPQRLKQPVSARQAGAPRSAPDRRAPWPDPRSERRRARRGSAGRGRRA